MDSFYFTTERRAMKTKSAATGTEPLSGPIEMRRLADLKPHPRHNDLFHRRPYRSLDRLAADIRRHGLGRPVEVTVDNFVIDGHGRIEAVRRLGRKEIAVCVRRDLADDWVAIDRRHIEVNVDRPSSEKLDRVRLAVRMLEIEKGREFGKLLPADRPELRKRVAYILGTSGAKVADYITIAAAPMWLQRQLLPGATSLARVVGLARDLIATRNPPRPFRTYFDRSEELKKFIAALDEGMSAFAGGDYRITYGLVDHEDSLRVLGQFSDISRELMSRLEAKHAAIQKSRQQGRKP
jgi:hypothetical protein